MPVEYRDGLAGITVDQLQGGFFEDWPEPPSPAEHLKILASSDVIGLAIDMDRGQVVGFVTALADGIHAAFVSVLTVLPGYRGQGIGTELMQRLLDRLGTLNAGQGVNVDLSCNEELVPFYQRFGMEPGRAMWLRPSRDR